jgi:16S rRNA (cytidine1402-2'-O)-methyltransferase
MQLRDENRTLAFFESPRRIVDLLAEIAGLMGDRRAVLCREMTKRHEECLRGRLSQLIARLSDRPQVKGECTVLVAGKGPAEGFPEERLETEIRRRMASDDEKIGVIARDIARELGVSKNSVYEKVLKIRRDKAR